MRNKDTILLEDAYQQVQANQNQAQNNIKLKRGDTGNRLMNFLYNNVSSWADHPDMKKYKYFTDGIPNVLKNGINDETYEQAVQALGEIAKDPTVSEDKREVVQGFFDSMR